MTPLRRSKIRPRLATEALRSRRALVPGHIAWRASAADGAAACGLPVLRRPLLIYVLQRGGGHVMGNRRLGRLLSALAVPLAGIVAAACVTTSMQGYADNETVHARR